MTPSKLIEDVFPAGANRAVAPPQRVLMGPGPSDVPTRVLQALSGPCIGHLDPVFSAMMEEMKGLLRYVFQTRNAVTFPVSGPGTAAMEGCLANLVEPGDKVLVAKNGAFGGRLAEMARRQGGDVATVDFAWGEPVDPNKVDEALRANPGTKILAFVHAETSTGAESDAAALCALARDHGALTVMDAVTSLGGSPVLVDEWGADAVYSGSQKCLSVPPGLAPVTFSERAIDAVKARKTPVTSWFLDLNQVLAYWSGEGGRSYHHTAPTSALYGLREGLVMLRDEGLEASWARHARLHRALVAGLEAMGMEMLVPAAHRLNQLNSVRIPAGVDDEAAVRRALLDEFGLEIGAGIGDLAGKVWRIGLMGASASERNVLTCLGALEAVLPRQGAKIDVGKALPAAWDALGG